MTTKEELQRERQSLNRYLGERHTDWGFRRALKRLDEVDKQLLQLVAHAQVTGKVVRE